MWSMIGLAGLLVLLLVLGVAPVARNPGTQTREVEEELADDLKAVIDGNLSANLLSNVVPTEDSVWADQTEATFPGYTPVAAIATWTKALTDDGDWVLRSPLLTWTAGVIVVPEMITGFALTLDPAAAALYYVGALVTTWAVNVGGESMAGIIEINVSRGTATFTRSI